MKKIALGLCVFCMAFGLPFANGEKEGGGKTKTVELSMMIPQGSWRDVYADMAAAVKADTGYSVEFQVIPDDQFYPLLQTKLATGEVPDLVKHNIPTNNTEMSANQTMVDLSNEPWVSRLVNPNILKDPQSGKIFALPIESSSFFGGIYYNKAVLKKLGISEKQPATWNDLLNVLRKIKQSGTGIVPVACSEKDSWTTQVFTTLGFPVAVAKKPQVWNQLLTNKIKWSQVPEFKTILDRYTMLFKEGLVNDNHLSFSYDMAKEAVATGKAAMMINGEWVVSDMMAKWPGVEIGYWNIPFTDSCDIIATGNYVGGFFVPKKGNAKEGVKFLEIWSRPKYQNMYFTAHPGFSGLNDVKGGPVPQCVQDIVDTYIKTGKYVYEMNAMVNVASPILPELWKYYVEMTAGIKTPEQVLKAWDVLYSDYMKARKESGF